MQSARMPSSIRGLHLYSFAVLFLSGCASPSEDAQAIRSKFSLEQGITHLILADSDFARSSDGSANDRVFDRIKFVLQNEVQFSSKIEVQSFSAQEGERQKFARALQNAEREHKFDTSPEGQRMFRDKIQSAARRLYDGWWGTVTRRLETWSRAEQGRSPVVGLVAGGNSWLYFAQKIQEWEARGKGTAPLVVLIDPLSLPGDEPYFGRLSDRYGIVFWTLHDYREYALRQGRKSDCKGSESDERFSKMKLLPNFSSLEFGLDAGNYHLNLTELAERLRGSPSELLREMWKDTDTRVYDTAGRLIGIAVDTFEPSQRPDATDTYAFDTYIPRLKFSQNRRASSSLQGRVFPIAAPSAADTTSEGKRLSFVTGSELRIARISSGEGHRQLDAGRTIFANLRLPEATKASLVSAMEWRAERYAHTAVSENHLSQFAAFLEGYVYEAPMLEIPLAFPVTKNENGVVENDEEEPTGAQNGVRREILYYRKKDILYLLAALSATGSTYTPPAQFLRQIGSNVEDIRKLPVTGQGGVVLGEESERRIRVKLPRALAKIAILYRAISRAHQALLFYRNQNSEKADAARALVQKTRDFFWDSSPSKISFQAFRDAFDQEFVDKGLEDSVLDLSRHQQRDDEEWTAPDRSLYFLIFMPDSFFAAMNSRRNYSFDPAKPSFAPLGEDIRKLEEL